MKRVRTDDTRDEEEPVKRKQPLQSTMDSFFGSKPAGPPPNPALRYGIRVYTTKEVEEAEGLEGQFRLFWNTKASELCSDAAVRHKLQNKTAIQGAIHTSWILHKTGLMDLQVDKMRFQAKEAYQDDEMVVTKLGNVERNLQRMKDCNDRICVLSKQLEEGSSEAEAPAQLTSELTELKKAQQALKKAMQRKDSEIQELIQERQKQLLDSMPPVPTLTDQELQEVVCSVTEEGGCHDLEENPHMPQEEVTHSLPGATKDPIQSSVSSLKTLVQYDSSDSD